MMTEWEREKFLLHAGRLADDAHSKGESIPSALTPLFHQALREHLVEEGRHIDDWDRLTSRRVL